MKNVWEINVLFDEHFTRNSSSGTVQSLLRVYSHYSWQALIDTDGLGR